MEPLTKVKSKYLKDTAYMYHSVRKPGYVYVYIAKAKLDYGIAVSSHIRARTTCSTQTLRTT